MLKMFERILRRCKFDCSSLLVPLPLLCLALLFGTFPSYGKEIKLAAEDINLLEASVTLQELEGEKVWPGFSRFKTQVAYTLNHTQILLNVKNAPDYYLPYTKKLPRWAKGGFYTAPPRKANGDFYSQIELDSAYIAAAFSSNQTGKHYPYSIFFIDSIARLERKMGWKVDDWMAIFWHEIFHNFQDEKYDPTLVNDSVTDSRPINDLMKDEKYFIMVMEELKLIREALKSPKKDKFSQCKKLIKSREDRFEYSRKIHGENSNTIEKFYELSEGTARYVEEMLSLSISKRNDLEKHIPLLIKSGRSNSFKKYRTMKKSDYYSKILNLSLGQPFYYQTGFATALLLDQLSNNWKQDIFKTKGFMHSKLLNTCK